MRAHSCDFFFFIEPSDLSLNISVYRCMCGNCSVTHLAGAREFRCCYEILQTRGKFTFIGLDAECILNHPDFSPLTNRIVLEQVGPLLRDKDGRHYRKRNDAAQNK